MVAEAERADDEKAVDLLAAALDLWRGAPLSDLSAHRELHEAMAVPLDAVRRRAVAALGERLVRLGRGGEVLVRLAAELSQEPVRRATEPTAAAVSVAAGPASGCPAGLPDPA